jgi:hypothetical protein
MVSFRENRALLLNNCTNRSCSYLPREEQLEMVSFRENRVLLLNNSTK